MFGIKTSLSKEWVQRFNNVALLNEYAASNKLTIRDSIVDGMTVTGAVFSDATFENTDWEGTSFVEANIKNSVFRNGKYRNSGFQKSILENTVFEGITFINGDFQGASLKNVKFINCNFGRAKFQYLDESDVVFENSVLEEVEFYHAKIDVKFIGSKLTEIEMMGTQAKEYFIVKDSDIYDVDLGNSTYPYVEITNSTVKKATFASGKAKKIVMKDLKGAMDTSGAVVDGNIMVENVETEVLFLSGATAKEIHVKNLVAEDILYAGSVDANLFEISNSNIKSIWNGDSNTKVLKIINTELRGTRNENSKIEIFRFENVTLNGKFNFDGSHADKMELINVTKGPDFQFRGNDSNIKL